MPLFHNLSGVEMKNAKSKRGDAERAAVWVAREIFNCVVTRRAVRTQWQSVDFFGADVVGKKDDGSHVYIQVTAGQDSAVTTRRRKLEKYPWHISDDVYLLQLRQTEDPANARRKLWFFRVHYYSSGQWYTENEAIPVNKEWFKTYKEHI